MISAGSATEAQMYACFLRAELDSPTEAGRLKRALSALGEDADILLRPDLSSEVENERRRRLFELYRGSEPLLEGLCLREMSWQWVDLTEADLCERTLSCRHHFESTYGTRRIAEIAATIERQQPPVANAVTDRLMRDEVLEPPILVAEPDMRRFIVLEGHNRVIGYLRNPSVVRFPIRALVGVSPQVSQWREW